MSYTITFAQPIEKADRVTVAIAGAGFNSFSGRLDVLPGDFNDDGRVNQRDVKGIRARDQRHGRRHADDLRRHQR